MVQYISWEIGKMNQQHSSGEELESQQSRDLTELKKQIQLSNLQLLELTHNDEKFINYIHQLNNKGVHYVSSEEHKEAVIYFNECEKILEYAASCGKTIDRSIIVVTLHNQACVNQKLWDLEKSANYLEAIIYNINFYFETTKTQRKYRDHLDEFGTYLHKKQLFALYHLQFCAVNSQIRKHAISLSSAKAAIRITREVCHELFLLSEKVLYEDLGEINKARLNSSILQELSKCDEELMINDYQKYFGIVRDLVGEKHRNVSSAEDDYKNIRNFSIGKLMQLAPITINQMQNKQEPKDWIKADSIVTIALHLGVCYFTVGTELRFISSQNIEDGNQVYKLSEDFLISQVYHIYAIMIVLKYVPVRSIFLNHLLTSFHSHYQIDLEKIFVPPIIPQIKIRKTQKKEGDFFSYASSQQLHLAASTLPQESEIKIQALKSEEYPVIHINQDFKNQKPQAEIKDSLQLPSKNYLTDKKLTNRSKSSKISHKNNLNKTKKQEPKSKSRNRARADNSKAQTLINLHKKLDGSKFEKSLKSRSKTKSDFHKSTSIKKKSPKNKFCIYTTKIKKDTELQSKEKRGEKNSTKKSKSKQRQKNLKQNKFNHKETKKKSLSKQKEKGKQKDKQKQKINSRNMIGRLDKKIDSPNRQEGKESINKTRNKSKVQRLKVNKMNKVEGAKY